LLLIAIYIFLLLFTDR